ncbi:hypothetical protein HO133_009017 [Letharia lupina]|uniref:Uncharacterized protein n=1 Tax=Letharia lupina TaxID=560253 RepID=A0A8H6CMW8_9LECA|nr:uncharacterized protein HO133_009017 [Letharia lupina]KAF6226151.1 hypothetical protein HO133_009017 [Letharia lupina]
MALSQVMKRPRKLLQDSSQTLCRALGLNVIFSFFVFLRHKAVGKGYTEPTKIAIRRSRTAALLRALIHIVPVGVALWEIVLNWNTYFVGYAIYNQAYYQFGAKIHEIAIEASLSAVIFSYVRYELMLGDGIPFGALFSGLQVSQASYLWSMEFWGTVRSKNISLKSKLRLLVVVTASVFLAAVAGPTNASELPMQCLNANTSDIYTFACPSHGWEAVQDFIYTTMNTLDPKYLALIEVVGLPEWVEVTGHGSLRHLVLDTVISVQEGYDPDPIVGTTQQSVIADALTETGNLWTTFIANISTRGHGSVLQQLDAVHTIKNGYYQPYTIASCATDVIHGPHDDSAVAFPVPPADSMLNRTEYNDSILDVYSFVYPGITKNQILGTPGSLEESRLRWVELPQDPFNGSAIGAVILLPRSTLNSTQEFLVCNLGAGWGSSIINTSSFAGGTTFTTSVVDLSAIEQYENPPEANQSSPYYERPPRAESLAKTIVSQFNLPFFPEKPIIVTEVWANYLNPFIPALNTTVIDTLMSTHAPVGELSSEEQIGTAKWALAGLLANGLASIGATSTLQGNLKTVVKSDGSSEWAGDYWFSGKGDVFTVDPEESKDWVKLRVDSTVNGYAYNIRGASPKVAISFLLAYCITALSHILYAGISGISSTCWDSIGEVTALAMNSTPTTLLKNTCAGIMELNIFKLPVRVLAIRDDEGDGEHLELVFGNVDEKDVRGTPIKPNRVYGTLPKLAKEQKSE